MLYLSVTHRVHALSVTQFPLSYIKETQTNKKNKQIDLLQRFF